MICGGGGVGIATVVEAVWLPKDNVSKGSIFVIVYSFRE
jgi:hypothetical protein